MSAGAFVFGRLNGQTAAGARVYPLTLPQQPTVPAVTYQQVSAVRLHAMGVDAPLVRVRMQLNLWGKSYAEARLLAAQVLGRLGRFRGVADGCEVKDVLLDNELELYESETQTRRVVQDYTLILANND